MERDESWLGPYEPFGIGGLFLRAICGLRRQLKNHSRCFLLREGICFSLSDFSPLMHATILFAFRPYVFKNSGVCSRIFEDVPDYAVEVPSCERFLS